MKTTIERAIFRASSIRWLTNLTFGLMGLLLPGCHSAPEPPAPRVVTLAAGTAVKLVLFDELTSGGSERGSIVRLALAEPLDGLPLLSPVSATVSQSRSEGSLGGILNQPARLNIELQELKGPNGESIKLSADPSEAKEYEFNRANTGIPDAPASSDAADETAQIAVKDLIKEGQNGGRDAKQVGELAKRLNLSATSQLADAGRLGEAQNLIRAVRDGGSIAGLATGGTAAAAMELLHLAGGVSQRLGHSLGGRNIRAYPGTVVPAYIAKDTQITLLSR